MLAGDADFGRIQLGKRSQLQEQRAELNRFRPRTENEKDGSSQGSSQRDAFSLALTLERNFSRVSWNRSATTPRQPRSCSPAREGRITREGSRLHAHVIPTDEGLMMAHLALHWLNQQ